MSAVEQVLEEPTQLCRSTLLDLAEQMELKPREVFLRSASGAESATDPFACGTPGEWRWAEWFAEIFEAVGRAPIHNRGIHYWLVGRDWPLPESMREEIYTDGLVYLNTKKCWLFLERAATYARWLGLVPVDAIEDNRNEEAQCFAGKLSDFGLEEPDLESVAEILAEQMAPHYSAQKRQPYHLEIVAEKSSATMQEIARDYHANLTIATGHPSITRARDMFKRIMATTKPTRIFFLSDFDAAGHFRPEAGVLATQPARGKGREAVPALVDP